MRCYDDKEMYNFTYNNNKYDIVCKTADTRSGFKHIADVYVNFKYITSYTTYYYNRTWESYKYQSVLHKALKEMFCHPEMDYSKSKRGKQVIVYPSDEWCDKLITGK